MIVGVEIGHGPGDFMLDGDPTRLPRRGGAVTGQLADTPTRGLPTRGLDILRTGQLADWTTRGLDKSRSRRCCQKRKTKHGKSPMASARCPVRGAPSPILGPFLLLPNGWMHQDVSWHGCRLHPIGEPMENHPPLPKRGRSPQFSAHFCRGQTAA